jgi:DNA methylase
MANLDFEGENTRFGVHALHPYAAKCPPQLVRYGLRYYSRVGDTVLDPMIGSGTTLAEARRLGRNAIGYDIDPLARLIAAVKLGDLSDRQIEKGYNKVADATAIDLKSLKSGRATAGVKARAALPNFPNRDYWFDRDVAVALALLGYHISSISAAPVRRFLWVAFSSIILAKKSVANARDIIHSRQRKRRRRASISWRGHTGSICRTRRTASGCSDCGHDNSSRSGLHAEISRTCPSRDTW